MNTHTNRVTGNAQSNDGKNWACQLKRSMSDNSDT